MARSALNTPWEWEYSYPLLNHNPVHGQDSVCSNGSSDLRDLEIALFHQGGPFKGTTMSTTWENGATVWVACQGSFDAPPWGLYEGSVAAVKGDTVDVHTAEGLELSAKWNSVQPGEFITYSGTGVPGKACLSSRDDRFPAQGYADMTNMNQVNDAELARNLHTLYSAHNAYCRCGATLVALNLMRAVPVYSQDYAQQYLNDASSAQVTVAGLTPR